MNAVKSKLKDFGATRIIIITFLLILLVVAALQGQNMATLGSDIINRFGMNLFFSLAMVPAVISGTGLNFGITIGILAGILAGLISIEMGLTGMAGICAAIAMSIPFALLVGYAYGKLLNAVKGNEMVVGTYVGYSVVSLMCAAWLLLPFKSPNMIWTIGGEGLRTTITLDGYYDKIFSKLWSFEILGVKITTGTLLICAVACVLMYVFTKSRLGIAMTSAGTNPVYASAVGINVNKMRVLGTILSTVLGAVGIIVYAQAFGFYQLYTAPLNMSFAPIAAVLIGGASTRKIKISHVLLGTLLYQAIITVAVPVAAALSPDGALGDVARIIVSNGIILYALAQSGGNK